MPASNRSKLAIVVAAILCLCLVAMTAFQGVQKAQAAALDLREPCSITLEVSNNGQLTDEEPSPLYYKLYKVADAIAQSGFDAYDFDTTAPFTDLKVNAVANGTATSETYTTLANDAATIIATADPAIAPEVDSATAGSHEVDAGLYLVVAYGPKDASDETQDANANVLVVNSSDVEGAAPYVSKAYSESYEFTFAPQLIALPTKEAVGGVISTANPGDWLYTPTVTLKPEIDPRAASLTITKKLLNNWYGVNGSDSIDANASDWTEASDSIITPKNTTFVFKVVGTIGDETVYDNVVTLNYTPANDSVTISDIPMGAHVVITEVYSGATFESWMGDTKELDIVSATNSVEFQNRYIDKANNGGSVTNSFEYDEDASWTWSLGGKPGANVGGDE